MDLSESEVRVLGCMLEKQVTTPDAYPLTLNGLRLACNQSTNRDPVVDYEDATLRDALHRLERRGWARLASGRGSRAPKYRHLLEEALPLREDERTILCVLMLRGPQTPGELKQRAERMHAFDNLDAIHETLDRLIGRELAQRLERRPGQKEERYQHMLSADLDDFSPRPTGGRDAAVAQAPTERVMPIATDGGADGRNGSAGASLAALEDRVARLERELAQLRETIGLGAPET
jgi:uncharacterized protein